MTVERIAASIEGVKTVVREIAVSPGPTSDADIVQIAMDVLKRNDDIQGCEIKVIVQNEWATLEGEVEWDYQKKSAGSSVEDIVGVTGIINNIKLNPKMSPEEATRKTGQIKSAVEQMIPKKER